MSTLGKVCLVLTTLLLLLAMVPIPGPYGGWSPKLLIIHNEWSEKFRDAREKTSAAIRANSVARQELSKATADIEGLNVGWDQFWVVNARGPNNGPNSPQVNVMPDGRLQLVNLGLNAGLKPRPYTDDDNSQKTMNPTVHAFVGAAEGFIYAGEYVAEDIQASRAVLSPVHILDGSRMQAVRQNQGNVWRLRTLVPVSQRKQNDELNAQLRRIGEMRGRTEANITRQQELKKAAEVAYNIRRGELLGDDTREEVQGRPEFTAGLLNVIEDTEEQRNQLQLDIDALRRRIKATIEEQQDFLDSLNNKVSSRPQSIALEDKSSNQ
ncbi:MAG: hypothetical protein NXI04_19190 [Planctomycetaceae bacterium]|nr:hypothetical protein [Planctomycetaceae bacterium]